MNLPIFLAHGALGPWDEVIFLSVFAIFAAIMGVAWVRSRAIGDDDLDEKQIQSSDDAADESPDRFTLN